MLKASLKFALLLSFATLTTANAEAAQIVQSSGGGSVSGAGIVRDTTNAGGGLYGFTHAGSGSGSGNVSNIDVYGNGWFASASGGGSTDVRTGPVGGSLSAWAGASTSVVVSGNYLPSVEAGAWANAGISVTFDEPVFIRVAYAAGPSSNGSVNVTYNNQLTDYYGSGALDFVSTGLTLGARANAYFLFTVHSTDGPPWPRLQSSGGEAAISWAFAPLDQVPVLPGFSPSNPIKATFFDYEDEGATDPSSVTGAWLRFPAIGEIGHTGNAFVGIQTQVTDGPSTGALVTGYEVVSEFAAITSLVVPALPAGAEGLMLDFGSGAQSVVAGQTFDFGANGVQSFTLSGFDPSFASSELDAFVFGLMFAEEGLASLTATPTLFIPTGDHNLNGVVDAADYVIARMNGSEEPYNTWRSHFGDPTSSGTLSANTIPEPSSLILLAISAISLLGHSRRRSR